MDAKQKVNAVWVPLRKRLLELKGNKDGALAVLGTGTLFEVRPGGLELGAVMETINVKRAVETFRQYLVDFATAGRWDDYALAVGSIPEAP